MHIIAGKYKNRQLQSPKGSQTRPTSSRLRESLFNICQNEIEGAVFLDLFAGSGAIGFEAISRGAKECTFVDSHPHAISCIRENCSKLQVGKESKILTGDIFDMLRLLEKQQARFDIIFVDPPYATWQSVKEELPLSTKIIQWFDKHQLLKPNGLLFVEEDFTFQPKLSDLKSLELINSRRLGTAALQQYRLR